MPAFKADDFKMISLPHSPSEVAAGLAYIDGFVFFDSSGNLPTSYHEAVSVIAAEPDQILKGSIENSKKLELAIAEGTVMGWIDYDGEFCFGTFCKLLVFDHETQSWYSKGGLEKKIQSPSQHEKIHIGSFESNFSEKDYIQRVDTVKDYIAAGDIYQVNLTHRFETNVSKGSLYPLYESLRKSSPAPMASYLQLGDREVLSSSPETFLRMQGDHIETRPIKGTRPRFADPDKDRESAEELMASDKEVAELVMITDLERNDLGQVCEFGSITVPELTKLETLEHVYHLVSRVDGHLRPEINHLEALKACFPGGSITGAPKKRAMEIIEELETVPRGLYTGAVGYFNLNGESQFNIVIRSLIRTGDTLHYHVGAGIVADSDAQKEYEETLQKAKGIRAAVESFTEIK